MFHRLNVIRLRLPPLRERREDIALLVRHFLQKSARELGVETKRVSDEALLVLQNHAFPGNVRELENICHWLTVMAPGLTVDAKDLPPELRQPARALPAAQPQAIQVPTMVDTSPLTIGTGTGGVVREVSDEAALSQFASGLQPSPAASLPASPPSAPTPAIEDDWEAAVARVARELLQGGQAEVMDLLTQRFERAVIGAALDVTHGRRIEAAVKLGIGRNTITRKIQDLGLDD
ncbi:nitrogen assimilation regulatory protein [mine drainage metagenome]|uniref:Nitrogen assimilation regulatory protein n=1 Tax=mine drainage metagenome TaxID=410659 RepID=A0A1J5RI87_9ZZZZ